jgi:nitroimidazol reductase NimA-like FMN-containing flavoprotein (pyridoxamine 5'-phosphate oxidase superfamily)
MNSHLRQKIIALLHHCRAAHLAIAAPDGPWASVVRFISDDLVLYLLEAQASDLVYYVETRPHVVLTVGEAGAGEEGPEFPGHVQIFGTAQLLSPAEVQAAPQEVGDAYVRLNQKAPGIYVVIQVSPARIHYYSDEDGRLQRQTLDVAPQKGEST